MKISSTKANTALIYVRPPEWYTERQNNGGGVSRIKKQ